MGVAIIKSEARQSIVLKNNQFLYNLTPLNFRWIIPFNTRKRTFAERKTETRSRES
jgi:hypothetical protein